MQRTKQLFVVAALIASLLCTAGHADPPSRGKICKVVFGTLLAATAVAIGTGLVIWNKKGEDGGDAEVFKPPPPPPPAPGKNGPPDHFAKDEVIFGSPGEPPGALFFKKDDSQRMLSKTMNGVVYGEEKDEDIRKRLHQGEGLKMTLDGLVFNVLPEEKGKPRMVRLTVMGAAREITIPELIPLEDLKTGKEITRTFPKVGRKFPLVGSAIGTGSIKFSYDASVGHLKIKQFEGTFTVSAFIGKPKEDRAVIEDLTIGAHPVKRRPPIEEQYLIK